ncbi:MAG: MotA/TolQ/ExbB proton channel family protein [Leptospiraceae bacterium]|nr:MotA/TolQ/ExbB proton channel family protein [Leptospiraceae bacterium]
MVYGKSVYGQAFSTAFGSIQLAEKEKRDAANVFKLIGNVAVGFGWIGVLIGALAMLKNLGAGDMSALGIGIAADLITIFYAYILKYGFCKLAEYKVRK